MTDGDAQFFISRRTDNNNSFFLFDVQYAFKCSKEEAQLKIDGWLNLGYVSSSAGMMYIINDFVYSTLLASTNEEVA